MDAVEREGAVELGSRCGEDGEARRLSGLNELDREACGSGESGVRAVVLRRDWVYKRGGKACVL